MFTCINRHSDQANAPLQRGRVGATGHQARTGIGLNWLIMAKNAFVLEHNAGKPVRYRFPFLLQRISTDKGAFSRLPCHGPSNVADQRGLGFVHVLTIKV